MPGRTRIACLVAALAVMAAAPSEGHAVILKRLNYETGNFSQWAFVQAMPGGASIIKSPVRQGRYAARFVVGPGDDPINATGERSEVYVATGEKEGTESWWAWSTYFPAGFHPNINGSMNIFTQWHHTGTRCPPPVTFEVDNTRSPAKLKLRAWGGRLPTSCEPPSKRAWDFATLRRGRWYNFVFHVKWSSNRSIGFVKVWVNGRVRVPKIHTATLYEGQGVYLKQGFYRAPSSLTTTIIHDGMRRFRP
jgi:polysaccharide lyase-like protein